MSKRKKYSNIRKMSDPLGHEEQESLSAEGEPSAHLQIVDTKRPRKGGFIFYLMGVGVVAGPYMGEGRRVTFKSLQVHRGGDSSSLYKQV